MNNNDGQSATEERVALARLMSKDQPWCPACRSIRSKPGQPEHTRVRDAVERWLIDHDDAALNRHLTADGGPKRSSFR